VVWRVSLEERGLNEPDRSLLLPLPLGCFSRVSHQEGERHVGFYGSVFRVRIERSLEGFFGESVDLMVLFFFLVASGTPLIRKEK
jgi:hypothetical protein